MHRIFSGNGWLSMPEIRKSASDSRPSCLLVQETLVLLILCILGIDVVMNGPSRWIGSVAGVPHASSPAGRLSLLECSSPSWGSGVRARRTASRFPGVPRCFPVGLADTLGYLQGNLGQRP